MLDGNKQEPSPLSPPLETTVTETKPAEKPITDVGDTPMIEFGSKTKKKGKIKLIVGIAIAVVAVVAGAGVFYTVAYSPKAIFKSVINSSYKKFSSALEGVEESEFYSDTMEDSFIANGTLNMSTDNQELIAINDYTFGYNIGLDIKQEKLEAGVNITEGSTKLLDMVLNYKDSKGYVSFGEWLNKVIEIDLNEFNIDFADISVAVTEQNKAELTAENVDYIVKDVKDLLIDSLTDIEFKKTKDSIEVDGKTVKVQKVSFILDEDNMTTISNKVIDGILDNDDLLNKIAITTGKDKDEIEKYFEDAKDNMDFSNADESELAIYTSGITHKFVRIALISSDEDNAITIDDLGDKTQVAYSYQDDEMMTATINALDAENIDLEYAVDYMGEKLSGTLTFKDDKLKGSMELDSTTYGKATLNYSLDKTSDTKYSLNADIDTDLVALGFNFKMETAMFIESGAEVATLATEGAILQAELTAEDTTAITNGLNAILTSNLGSLITTITSYISLGGGGYTEPTGEDVYDEDGLYVTDETACGSIYVDEYDTYYNFDNNGAYTYVGEGEMQDGYCMYTPTQIIVD